MAGAFISLVGTVLAVYGKWFFDYISIDTKHTISVREKILERFHQYAGNYLMPIAAVAAQLSERLARFRNETDAGNHDSAREALRSVLVYVGKYIHLQLILSGELRVQNAAPPEGIFLSSFESEQLMWALIIQPWVFGIETLEQQSLLAQEVSNRSQVEFVQLLDDPKSPLHNLTKNVATALKEDWPNKITDLSNTLDSFNQVLTHELTVVYRSWYRTSTPYPRQALATVLAIPEGRRKQIGIFYRYPTKWAERKAYSWLSRRFRAKAGRRPS